MSSTSRRVFAIVPAAGESRRMGQAKLLLPWNVNTVIDNVLEAWTTSNVESTFVVTRSADSTLKEACGRWPVSLLSSNPDPRDMKESIQVALRHVSENLSPTNEDCWMVAPADLPTLTPKLIDSILAAANDQDVVAPRFGDRQGHPVLLSWRLANAMLQLPKDAGLDRLLATQSIHYVDFAATERLADIDTPAEYDQLRDTQLRDAQ